MYEEEQLRVQNWLQDVKALLIESLDEDIYSYPEEVTYYGVGGRYLSAEGVMAETPSPKRRMARTASVDNERTPRSSMPIHGVFDAQSTLTSSSSQTSSRNSSPTKRKADLDIMYPRIIFMEDLRRLGQEDWKFVDRIRTAAETFPIKLKDYISKHPVGHRFLRQVQWQEEPAREGGDMKELWEKVEELEDAANECSEEGRPEDCWSDDVVLELLRLSVRTASFQRHVKVANLKSVKVDPSALLPSRNMRVMPKRVDYGLCLQPDEQEKKQIENFLACMTNEVPSISQSTAPMLRKRSLFCNIEIKKAYGGQDPGPQLGIWCSAGLTKMANLAREKRTGIASSDSSLDALDIPPIPCWTVDGHRWQLYVARRRSSAEIEIQGPCLTYETNNVVHILFIVFALCEIERWGHHEYREWLMNIIATLPDSPNTLMNSFSE